MAKSNNTLLYVGAAAVGAYLLLGKSSKPAQTLPNGSIIPAGGSTTIGFNSGIKGGNGSFYTVANYSQLLAANPNLGNPNYQMTSAEINQYMANYSDLQQAFPADIQTGAVFYGIKSTSIQQLAQLHWLHSGCAEQRIFLPLQPPSTANYIPPPPNPATTSSSSGSGSAWVGDALKIAGTVAAIFLGPADNPQLNALEAQTLITGAAVLKKILPIYLQVDPTLVNSIQNKLDGLLSQYAV